MEHLKVLGVRFFDRLGYASEVEFIDRNWRIPRRHQKPVKLFHSIQPKVGYRAMPAASSVPFSVFERGYEVLVSIFGTFKPFALIRLAIGTG
ncbi:hypothetical protein AS149_37255 [Burkholderia cenocepacia]|nr:hypothetical protein AS149_37255 [Burkholderia cenocepacia]